MVVCRAVIVGLLVLSGAAVAEADVVGPPEDIDCPAGSEQSSCHGSEYCAPARCWEESDCERGEACQNLHLCLYETRCGGWDTTSYEGIDSACDVGDTCELGTCTSLRVCAPTGVFGAPGGGCSCRVDPGATRGGAVGLGLLLAAAALVVSLTRRSRRARPRRGGSRAGG